ncbi:MAG: hypothetical protein FJY81_01240, partial [Candidatus Aminicenantes bacterium]|nr:hypothetical protein [Candidatus Aminicenantes bacterium]
MPTVLGIKYSVPRILVGGLVCATWLSLSGLLGGYETRQLSLLVRADEECRLDPAWQEETKAVVDAVSRSFDKLFGIRFVIGEFGEWTSPDSVASLEHLAEDLEARSNKGPHDILVALTAQKNLDERYFGYSLFKEGLILIKMMGETRGLVKALEHEMAHLFGAVHVDDPDSLMDIHSRGNRFDDLNARIIRLNRDRTFYGTRFPLPKENWEETAALCRKIASAIQRTDREKKGERGSAARRPNLADVHLLLAQIYLEQAKYEAVMAECKKALRIDPSNLEGLNLYGVALRRSDRIDEAIEKYQEILT